MKQTNQQRGESQHRKLCLDGSIWKLNKKIKSQDCELTVKALVRERANVYEELRIT